MRCAECGFYECALRSPMGGCPNGERAEALGIITTPDTNPFPRGPYEKGYEPSGISPVDEILEQREALLDNIQEMMESAQALVEAVKGYVCPKKGDKYVFRNEVLEKCNMVKKLLGK